MTSLCPLVTGGGTVGQNEPQVSSVAPEKPPPITWCRAQGKTRGQRDPGESGEERKRGRGEEMAPLGTLLTRGCCQRSAGLGRPLGPCPFYFGSQQ